MMLKTQPSVVPKYPLPREDVVGTSPKLGDYTAKRKTTLYGDWLVHNTPIMSKAKED